MSTASRRSTRGSERKSSGHYWCSRGIGQAVAVRLAEQGVDLALILAQWQAVIDVNLTGVFLCAREVAESMIRSGAGGVVVNISSVSRHGNVGQTNYSAAKAGVAAMSIVWARELARYGIRVASIAPGFIGTDILPTMRPEVLEKTLRAVHRSGRRPVAVDPRGSGRPAHQRSDMR